MKYPKFGNIFTVFMNRCFYTFANLNSIFDLEILGFRNDLLNAFDYTKENYNLNKGHLLKNLLLVFEKFLSFINLEIPVEKTLITGDVPFKIETAIFNEKMDEIHKRVHSKLFELYDLFETTGLTKYMIRDQNILDKYKNSFELTITKDEYLVQEEELINFDDLSNSVSQFDLMSGKSISLSEESKNHFTSHVKIQGLEHILQKFKKDYGGEKLLGRKRMLILEKIKNLEVIPEISISLPSNQIKLDGLANFKLKNKKHLQNMTLSYTPIRLSFTANKLE